MRRQTLRSTMLTMSAVYITKRKHVHYRPVWHAVLHERWMVLTVRRGDTHDVIDAGPDTNGTTTRQRRSVQMCNLCAWYHRVVW